MNPDASSESVVGEKRGSDAHEPLCRVVWAESAPNKALEPTPYSLRSCVASASGRGSPRALERNENQAMTRAPRVNCYRRRIRCVSDGMLRALAHARAHGRQEPERWAAAAFAAVRGVVNIFSGTREGHHGAAL